MQECSKLAATCAEAIVTRKIVRNDTGMFGLAYVLLPFSGQLPAEAITQSMARFQMGRRGNIPDEWLSFHDDTAELRKTYENTYNFTLNGGLHTAGGDSWYLNTDAVIAAMQERDRESWTVSFAEVEPDFDAFIEKYNSIRCERHPVTGGFGRWLNGLGQWDWWELGGRFNGLITGHERGALVSRTTISSGYSKGREALEVLAGALADALGDQTPDEIEISSDDNIELVATLSDAAKRGLAHAKPGALVLPPGSAPDKDRWLDAWPDLFALAWPEEQKSERRGQWHEIVRATYERFHDHWVAAVAYHF
jgi:hypothetical protein